MSTAPPLTAAVVGTGFIGPVHVEALRRAGVQVAGILGSTAFKSLDAANALGLSCGYESFEQVLQDENVDCIHITTPNRLHFSQTKMALEAGKHVLCEKPLAMTSVESAELVELAKKVKRAAGVAYNIRFYPLCHEAAARVRSDGFGRLMHVTGSYTQDWLLNAGDFNWRVLAAEGGELRALADIGTHWLDLVQFITDQKVTEVFADLQTVHPTRFHSSSRQTFTDSQVNDGEEIRIDTEDAGNVLLRFEDGSRGSLHVSQTTAGRKNCLQFTIAGAKQSLAFNSERPNEMWVGSRSNANELLVRDPSLLASSSAEIANYPGGHAEGFPDTFKQLFIKFYQSIRNGTFETAPDFPTFADGHREIKICEAILASHRQQCWVPVDHT